MADSVHRIAAGRMLVPALAILALALGAPASASGPLKPQSGPCRARSNIDDDRITPARNHFVVNGVNCEYAFLSAVQYLDSFTAAVHLTSPGSLAFRAGGAGWAIAWKCRTANVRRAAIKFACRSTATSWHGSPAHMRFTWLLDPTISCHREFHAGSMLVSSVEATRNFGCVQIDDWIRGADAAARESQPNRTTSTSGDYATSDAFYKYGPWICDVRRFPGPGWGPPDGHSVWTCTGTWHLPPQVSWVEDPS